MAYITAEINLPEVGVSLPVQLYFPTDLPATVGCEVRGVITLLHGMGGSAADWMHFSAACRYAADNGYILVAPNATNSFYTDMAFGPPWYTIITELLPAQLQRIFKIPTRRAINYIAGLSMGGYGALRIGLSHPGRYAAVASFSGAVDMATLLANLDEAPQHKPIFAPLFGPDYILPDEANVFKLAEKVAALPEEQRPRVWCSCGRADTMHRILEQNQNLARHMKGLPLDYTLEVWDGVHEWNFWDRSLAEFIGFVQNSDYGARKRGDWAAPGVRG